MGVSLAIVSGPAGGQSIPVQEGTLTIGRETECAVRVDDPFVSGLHCVLIRDATGLRVRDLGSKNGTFVNGKCIGDQFVDLNSGDFLSVGTEVFRVDLKRASGLAP